MLLQKIIEQLEKEKASQDVRKQKSNHRLCFTEANLVNVSGAPRGGKSAT
jgi:hypothetical protein